jgi:ketosteroid isomerase-like protein
MADFATTEAAIRQLHARYADAVWRKDLAAFGDCFTDACEWRIGGRVIRGRAAIEQHMAGVFAQFRRILCTFRTPLLEVGEGNASARTYMTEQAAKADGTTMTPIGLYYERFACEAGVWRFSWRLFQTLYVGGPGLDGEFYEAPDYGPPPAMPPPDALTVNRTGIHTGASPAGSES